MSHSQAPSVEKHQWSSTGHVVAERSFPPKNCASRSPDPRGPSSRRILRARAGLTQEELAVRAEITAPYISRVEGGWRDIRWSTLQRLLIALGADMRQLADVIDESRPER